MNTNKHGVDLTPFWFVPPTHWDVIEPGDVVRIAGFGQVAITREGEQVAFVNIINPELVAK